MQNKCNLRYFFSLMKWHIVSDGILSKMNCLWEKFDSGSQAKEKWHFSWRNSFNLLKALVWIPNSEAVYEFVTPERLYIMNISSQRTILGLMSVKKKRRSLWCWKYRKHHGTTAYCQWKKWMDFVWNIVYYENEFVRQVHVAQLNCGCCWCVVAPHLPITSML